MQQPVQPPAAPTRTRSTRLELEPNPFEVSFQSPTDEPDELASFNRKGGSNGSAGATAGKKGASSAAAAPQPTRTRSSARNAAGKKEETSSSSTNGQQASSAISNAPDVKGAKAATTGPKRGNAAGVETTTATSAAAGATAGAALPGVAALTSPSEAAGNPFIHAWMNGSLRTGPLSPAMLGGSSGSQQGFDASTFRTGFTPDLSNYKTGLTPLGGISFPPPSPNTAAFLAMVGNGGAAGAAGAAGGAAMTPNTLNALAGSAAGLVDSTAPHGAVQVGSGGIHPQPFDYAFSRSIADKPTSRLRSSTTREEERNGAAHSVSPEMINNKQLHQHGGHGDHRGNGPPPPPAAPGTSGAGAGGDAAAASGLFLLSHAGQELSKREDADEAAHAAAQALTGIPRAGGPGANGAGGHQMAMYTNDVLTQQQSGPSGAGGKRGATAGKKRKGGASQADEDEMTGKQTKGKAAKNKKAKADAQALGSSPLANAGGHSGGGGDHEMSGGGPGSNAGGNGSMHSDDEFGDGDDKRRNFLERNRQAALKCRQRKKAWLQSLQAKVEFLTADNEGLQNTVGALRSEIVYLKTQLMHVNAQLLAQQQAAQHGGAAEGAGNIDPTIGEAPPSSKALAGLPPANPSTYEQVNVTRGT